MSTPGVQTATVDQQGAIARGAVEVTSLRQVTRDQWRAFWAVFLGWVVDSFDFNILAFIVIDIQRSFTVDRALAGALGTVTLIMRLVGGTIAGTAADRYGRKLPLMLSVHGLPIVVREQDGRFTSPVHEPIDLDPTLHINDPPRGHA